ncbi:retrotransposon gag protein [Holotrichia oblita]|uniref:Retrotransposon gag protein n=1 Tax=Holotrichia oblita TaxID=644536 RepID=A0ACB9T8L5_HOLOL|nr:retrotransposon gag protein [Holotrichia oblita]
MPDLSKNISTFTGEPSPSAEIWLDNVINTANVHSWPDSFTLATARLQLSDAAKHWYESRYQSIQSWEDFEIVFRNTFCKDISLTECWKLMQKKTQGPKESVNSYFHEKGKYYNRLKLPVEDLKEQIVIGLWSRELSALVVSRNHKDIDELYNDILKYERINKARQERKEVGKESFRKETEERTPRGKKENRKCYNGNEGGHTAKECKRGCTGG